ncbi:hypothetical protein M406DRAFT_321966, partial [Cryphonectria parasitica EP155]
DRRETRLLQNIVENKSFNSGVFVGELELDVAEAAIVYQEALRHSLSGLAVVLHDIREEDFWQGQLDEKNALFDRVFTELSDRHSELLRNVDALQTQ